MTRAVANARQELRISEAMAQRIRARLTHARQLPNVTAAELAELERYWRRLEATVGEHRAALARLEARRAIGFTSDAAEKVEAMGPSSRSIFVVVPERTERDEIEALDAELNSSLSRFDGMLLQETERLRRSAAQSSVLEGEGTTTDLPAGMVGGTERPGGENAGMTAERRAPAASSEQRSGRRGQGLPRQPSEGSRPGTGSAGTEPGIPPDIADGSDDDLVARQIREAAMNEPDPALREKLWEEYRKYKKSAG